MAASDPDCNNPQFSRASKKLKLLPLARQLSEQLVQELAVLSALEASAALRVSEVRDEQAFQLQINEVAVGSRWASSQQARAMRSRSDQLCA